MPKILLLPPEVVAKIAAGEVIERPASVVKELVENSLDAKAGYIRVEVKGGGLEEILVYDDGEGMDPEDLRICTKRHATSKISQLADLYRLSTLGFRGEALASMAEVSKLTIKSRKVEEETGYELRVEFGKIVSFQPTPFKKGTQVTIKNLFQNLPARLAFLKSKRGENARTLEVLKGLMLSHPEIKWEILAEGNPSFSWPGGSLKALLSYLFSVEETYFLAQEISRPPYRLELLLTSQERVYPHAKNLYFFVNSRWVKDESLGKLFSTLLRRYYGSYGYPSGVVKITTPPQFVDFNVHPAKWEVRFRREAEVFSLLEQGLAELFSAKKRVFMAYLPREKSSPEEDLPLTFKTEEERAPYGFLPAAIKKRKENPDGLLNRQENLLPEERAQFKLLGTFSQAYLLVEREKELWLVDQHALAERVIFERLKKKKTFGVQELLLGKMVRLTENGFLRYLEVKDTLEHLGFKIKELGPQTLLIFALPDYVPPEEAEWILQDLLENFQPHLNLAEELLKSTACRLARKKGEILSETEKNYLLEQMFKEGLFTCPHGRPLFWRITLEEVERRLKA